ncbi:histidine kinase [Mucilaginibacter sp. ZB1P21]|uniref:Histidine kinase n=2 Tax=Mucilaginibacter glaciei TaxID=2772109 RepID=A0A926S669_9SPHI|nr:histidine kinase [Mucilaginibacter glaciei]
MAINFYAIPRYWLTGKRLQFALAIIAALIITGLLFTIAQSYISNWIYSQYSPFAARVTLLSRGFSMATALLLLYGLYILIREVLLHLYKLQQVKHTLGAQIIREVIITLTIWLLILLPFWVLRFTAFFQIFGPIYLFVLPFCFCVYFLNIYWLVPRYKLSVNPNLAKYILSLLITGLFLGVIELSFLLQSARQWSLLAYIIFAWFPPFIISSIISWWVYFANEEKYKQLKTLKTALGASDANLQFLRSQINPHFLFNVLNTLYGTALSEKAEKTAEGIQKLGDMMRFMLHENTQDKIPLNREMEYLHNYIDLQNLRIALSENIEINANITDQYSGLNIAPMLLIPFIENAYKHGISFQHKSWINIGMQLTGNTLQLDVYNSLHADKDNDPERERSGIGLENVKQRLQLLYPGKHELVIRQNATEFFIHLTLQLS